MSYLKFDANYVMCLAEGVCASLYGWGGGAWEKPEEA